MRARMGKQLQIAHQMVKGPNPFGAPGFIACVHTTGRAPDRSVIMSQYVQRATGVAKQAAEVFSKRVVPPAVEYYNATMAKNAQYVAVQDRKKQKRNRSRSAAWTSIDFPLEPAVSAHRKAHQPRPRDG